MSIEKNNATYLILGRSYSDSILNNYSNILFLGKWCFEFNNYKEIFRSNKIFPSPYSSNLEIDQHSEKLNEYFEEAVILLTKKLNLIHKTNYDSKYWRLVFGSWLLLFLHIIYSKYIVIKNLKKNNQSNYIFHSYINTKDYCFYNMTDFNSFIITDTYNKYLFSKTLSFFSVNSLTKDATEISRQNIISNLNKEKSTSKSIKILLKNFIFELFFLYDKYISKYHAKYVFISPYIKFKFIFFLKLKSFPCFFLKRKSIIPSSPINLSSRSLLNEENTNEFLKYAFTLMQTEIPRSYIEDFMLYKECSLKFFPVNPKAIITGVCQHSCDQFKIWAAEMRLKGSKLIVNQHGGYYGIGKLKIFDKFDTSISDIFITYGWSDKYKNITIMPSPKLTEFSKKISKKFTFNKKILFIHLTLPKYPYYLYSVPFGELFYDYLSELDDFYKILSNDVKNLLTVRLSSSDYNLDLKNYYLMNYPDINIYKGPKTFLTHLNECSLAVVTYNATTYLETLAANFPTVIFWSLENSPIREEAMPYFEMLKSVGIFHDSANSAANFINEVMKDLPKWWLNEKVQEARLTFCKQYAQIDANWMKKWADMLKSV